MLHVMSSGRHVMLCVILCGFFLHLGMRCQCRCLVVKHVKTTINSYQTQARNHPNDSTVPYTSSADVHLEYCRLIVWDRALATRFYCVFLLLLQVRGCCRG